MDEALQQKIAHISYLQSQLKGLDVEKDKRLMVYEEGTPLEDVLLYYDGIVEINLCGVEFYDEFMRIKFYSFTTEDEKTTFYIKELNANGSTLVKYRCIGEVSDCEYEYMYIDVYGTEEVSYQEFSVIDLKIQVVINTGEADVSQKLKLICNTGMKIFAVKIGPYIEPLRCREEWCIANS